MCGHGVQEQYHRQDDSEISFEAILADKFLKLKMVELYVLGREFEHHVCQKSCDMLFFFVFFV